MKGEYLTIETLRIIQELEKENKELQDKIDKAIEYIEIIDNRNSYIDISELRYVYEILKEDINER